MTPQVCLFFLGGTFVEAWESITRKMIMEIIELRFTTKLPNFDWCGADAGDATGGGFFV